FFSSRRRHTRFSRDWSSDVCSSDLTVDPRARVDQVDRVELVAAVVALVTPGPLEAADRAGALDVAVGQGAPAGGRDRPLGLLLDHVPVAVQGEEQLLGHRVAVAGGGAGEQVVRSEEHTSEL